jgi:hypothetical protein
MFPPHVKTEEEMKRRSKEQWHQIIQDWLLSKKSALQWCRENAIPYQSFCNWRKKYLEHPPLDTFVEVTSNHENSHAGIELCCNDVWIHLSKDFDDDALARCLSTLRRLPC